MCSEWWAVREPPEQGVKPALSGEVEDSQVETKVSARPSRSDQSSSPSALRILHIKRQGGGP
jgi:hypothetical protein